MGICIILCRGRTISIGTECSTGVISYRKAEWAVCCFCSNRQIRMNLPFMLRFAVSIPHIYIALTIWREKNQSYSATGEELMKNGLTCLIPEATGSEIVLFRVEGKSSEEERYFF